MNIESVKWSGTASTKSVVKGVGGYLTFGPNMCIMLQNKDQVQCEVDSKWGWWTVD